VSVPVAFIAHREEGKKKDYAHERERPLYEKKGGAHETLGKQRGNRALVDIMEEKSISRGNKKIIDGGGGITSVPAWGGGPPVETRYPSLWERGEEELNAPEKTMSICRGLDGSTEKTH